MKKNFIRILGLLLINLILLSNCKRNTSTQEVEQTVYISEPDSAAEKKIDTPEIKESQKVVKNTKPEDHFITGLSSAKIYTMDEAENGSEFMYSDGRKFKIRFYYEQVDIMFYAFNENNKKSLIPTKFEIGYVPAEPGIPELKRNTQYLVGQYDFDADEVDELVIAIKDNDEMDGGLCINVFQLQADSWEPVGVMTGRAITGKTRAEIKMNRVTIQRNFRGLYEQWAFESGKFKDTNEY